jgi:hypothetical protein
MLLPKEARMRLCVERYGGRERWTYRDWATWRFLWKFFPWYARELHYREDFCITSNCMHWFWEDSESKERGYCRQALTLFASDRYLSTSDSKGLLASLTNELETVKSELVRDHNSNELPLSAQEKRAMAAELDSFLFEIKAGCVRESELSERARLLKTIAVICKDFLLIAGAARAAYEIITKILAYLWRTSDPDDLT